MLGYSFVLSLLLGWLVHKTVGFRVGNEAEVDGIDEAEHAETAYQFGGIGGARGRVVPAAAHPEPESRVGTLEGSNQ